MPCDFKTSAAESAADMDLNIIFFISITPSIICGNTGNGRRRGSAIRNENVRSAICICETDVSDVFIGDYIFKLQTAKAETPFPEPVNPSPSSVVAFTLTAPRATSHTEARLRRMVSIKGASLGLCATTVTSILLIVYPFERTMSTTAFNSFILSAPAYLSSLSGKSLPISPSAAAPSSAW